MDDLRQVRRPDGRAESDAAGVGGLEPHHHVDERRLAGAVFAEQSNPLARLDAQIDLREERPLAEGLREVLDLHDLVAAEFPAREARVEPACLRGAFRRAHALNALFHRKRALVQRVVAHERPEVHLVGGLFELGNLRLLLEVLLHTLLIAALLFDGIEAVVAAVEFGFAVFDLHDARDGAVEEIAVVRDGHDRAVEAADILLQPLRRLQVEVVRRLVEQENVRVLQNEPPEVHARLFAARERVEEPCAHLARDGQTVCHLIDGGVRVPAAEPLEAGGQVAVAAENPLV